MPLFYDTHAHLTRPEFEVDLPEVIARAASAGITRIITVGTDLTSSVRAIKLAEEYPRAFPPEEVLLLREQEPRLKENGEVSVRQRFVPIQTRIRFAFTAYAKAMRAAFTLGCSRTDWQDFKKLFTIRDRITHPRKQEELSILDEELDSIKRALDFVSENYSAVHEAIQREMWLRKGMPEPLFKEWMSWQTEACKAAHAGHLEIEWAALCERLHTEVDDYFGQAKSNGKG